MVSGHWEEDSFTVMTAPTPGMVYDYGGFPPETYKIIYPAPGAPQMDLIITVCDNAAGEVCPFWPGKPATAHWGYADPSAGDGSDDATATGDYATASGAAALAEGVGATATGSGAFAIANGATATGFNATATGENSVASGAGALDFVDRQGRKHRQRHLRSHAL